jgi:hypothetical protein
LLRKRNALSPQTSGLFYRAQSADFPVSVPFFNRENMKRCGTLHHEMLYSLLRDAEVFGKRYGGILDFAVLFFNHEPARKKPSPREGFC